MDLTHKYELKLKEKCTKGSTNTELQIWTQIKSRNQISTNSALHGIDDKLGETWLRQKILGFTN